MLCGLDENIAVNPDYVISAEIKRRGIIKKTKHLIITLSNGHRIDFDFCDYFGGKTILQEDNEILNRFVKNFNG